MHESSAQKIKRLEQENKRLRAESRLLQAILEKAPILISAKDPEGNVLLTNPRFAVLNGPAPEDYIGRNVFDLFPREIAEQLWENDLQAQQANAPIEAEEQVQHRDGSMHVYHTTKFRLLDETDALLGTCAISIDISNLKQLEFDAYHDYLTGLFNQRYFAENLRRDLGRARRQKSALMLALIDLDGFKDVNDSLGHDKGNQALTAVAHTMKRLFHRPDDVCMRVGGDEFAVLFMTDTKEQAEAMIHSAHEAINQELVSVLRSSAVRCTNSIGVKLLMPQDEVDFDALYADIDAALYNAKRAGKNQIYRL